MITTDLSYDLKRFPADKRIIKAIEYLRTIDKNILPGEYEIDGKDIYGKIFLGNTESAENRRYERHLIYTDIHYVIQGSQYIEYAPVSHFSEKPEFNLKDDIGFFNKNIPGSRILLEKKIIAVFFPEDCHKPLCMIEKPENIKICVVKVKL